MSSQTKCGFAMVTVLVFVALLSILVTSYLVLMRLDRTSTQNFSLAAKAQDIALSGLQEVTGDLLMEIDAGSRQDAAPPKAVYEQDDIRVYIPSAAANIVPARIGFRNEEYTTDLASGGIPRTLIRVSRGEDPFFDPASPPSGYVPAKLPPNRASVAPTNAKSANGRWLTPERWNKPVLLGVNPPAAFVERPPDWVYVTRAGSRTCSDAEVAALKQTKDLTDPDAVLGRYAFAIYDEGALLDINASGYQSDTLSDPLSTSAVGGKSALFCADLGCLPGLASSQEKLDTFIKWRNKGSFGHYGDFPAMLTGMMSNGLLKLQPQDSPFLSRQDLIEYFGKEIGAKDPLPFLGTFSRFVNAPSWVPPLPPPGYDPEEFADADYFTKSEEKTSANRNLVNVRFKEARTVSHYKDDGAPDPYVVKAGDALLQRKFSLAKLAWLEPNGRKADIDDKAIRDCFGLQWVNGNGDEAGYWEYVERGTNPLHIKTLAEVADEGREPNFFELLKAGILSGSLGKDPGGRSSIFGQHPDGSGLHTEGVAGFQFGPEENSMGYSEDKDRHILQIGANIIDQADLDSFPTAIYFPAFDEGAPAGRLYNTLYGNENLPYITRLFLIRGAYPGRGNLNTWLQPELWNPHQAPAAVTPPPPAKFRVRSYGRAQTDYYLVWGGGENAQYKTTGIAKNYDGEDRASGIIYFQAPAGEESFFYATPRTLPKSQVDTERTASTNYYDPDGINPSYPNNKSSGSLPDKDLYEFAGIWAGMVNISLSPWIPDPKKPTDGSKGTNPWMNPGSKTAPPVNDWHVYLNCTPLGLTVSLECWDESANVWRPYTFLSRLDVALKSNNYDSVNRTSPIPRDPNLLGMTAVAHSDRELYTYARPDPRTDRFSAGVVSSASGPSVRADRFMAGNTMENGSRIFGLGTRFPSASRGFQYTAGGKSTDNVRRLLSAWAINQPNRDPSTPALDPNRPATALPSPYELYNAYYADPDGVVRPGDSLYRQYNTGDGCMLFNATVRASTAQARRPVILNRPFQSVGELGYVYRDVPFKTLDLFTPESGDAALLELFSITDEGQAKVAGKLNPNSAPKEVLHAVIAGATQKSALQAGGSPVSLSREDAESVATEIAAQLALEPITDASGLVAKLSPAIRKGFINSSSVASVKSTNQGNKTYAEAPVRALAAVTNLRTWNLLIDIVAQSGRISPRADDLDDFIVEGEKRYWLHVAIDRVTGKLVDQQLEPVYE